MTYGHIDQKWISVCTAHIFRVEKMMTTKLSRLNNGSNIVATVHITTISFNTMNHTYHEIVDV